MKNIYLVDGKIFSGEGLLNKAYIIFVDEAEETSLYSKEMLDTKGVDAAESLFSDYYDGEFEILSDIVVSKENIHLYYEFMSDKDKIKYIDNICGIFAVRNIEVLKKLSIDPYGLTPFVSSTWDKNKDDFMCCSSMTTFGIKDTLKPIDEYIEEIKDSKEYKRYLSTLDNFDNWIKTSLFGSSFGMTLNKSLRVDENFIYYTPTTSKHYGGTVKSVGVKNAIPKRFISCVEHKEYLAKKA